jgi:hypothetical protein
MTIVQNLSVWLHFVSHFRPNKQYQNIVQLYFYIQKQLGVSYLDF